MFAYGVIKAINEYMDNPNNFSTGKNSQSLNHSPYRERPNLV